jgi:sugar phosphate isomerase/epimerase
MFLGYNTNGLANHDLHDAVELLAEFGYQGVAITLDHHALNPFRDSLKKEIEQVRELLACHNMRCAIETGARYLLDPRRKHEPTLISPEVAGRARRLDFLKRSVDIAQALAAECVSIWSGKRQESVSVEQADAWIRAGLQELLEYAGERDVVIGFEPEPGMLVDTMERYAPLDEQFAAAGMRLTLDIGHLQCMGELPLADQIRRWGRSLAHVHIEDMKAGEHEHLQFGEGEVDFGPVIAALAEVGYDGGLYVELSRHSHVGPGAAQDAYRFLAPLLQQHSQ